MPTTDVSAPSIADPPRQRAARVLLPRGLADRLETLFDRERDQLPLWIPVGLGLGIAAWFVLPDAAAWSGFLLLGLAAALAFLGAAGEFRWGRALALFALAAALGCALIWLRAERVAAPRLERPTFTELTAEIAAVERIPARQTVGLMLRPSAPSALPPKLRVSLTEEQASADFRPGAVIRLKARLMPPAPMPVPGGYDFARIAWFEGIGATGKALGEVALVRSASDSGWKSRLSEWRQRLADHVRSRIDGGAGAIAATLATGDRGGIGEEDAEAMRRSGLAHLLSISGLHVAAVVGAAMLLPLPVTTPVAYAARLLKQGQGSLAD